MENNPNPAVHARIDAIEKSVEHLAASVNDFAAETRRAITALSDRVGKESKTDWKVVLAGLGILVTCSGFGGALIGGAITSVEEKSLLLHIEQEEEIDLMLSWVDEIEDRQWDMHGRMATQEERTRRLLDE